MPGGRNQGDARRQTVFAQRPRQRQRAQIGQVGEIGVSAELRIEQHRLLRHLRQGADSGRGRHHQRVERRQPLGDLPRQLGAQVFRLVGVAGAVAEAVADDAAHHRIDGLRARFQHLLNGYRALRHPGAVIQLFRQSAKRREIEGFQRRAARLQLRQRTVKRPLGLNVAEKLQLGGNGETRCGGDIRRRGMRIGTGIRVCRVKAARQLRHLRGVGHGQREDRHRIVQPAGRHHAAVGQPPLGRLQPDDVVEPGGHAPRTGGVGAERERHQAARHHRGGAGAGTAADVAAVEAVDHRAIR